MQKPATDIAALEPLLEILRGMGPLVIAFSGGVDSSLLLKAAVLSGSEVTAVTGVSPTMPEEDFSRATEFVRELGIEHVVIKTSELENEDFVQNPRDRCFYCKDDLFSKLTEFASRKGGAAVVDGSNLDDLQDWRPGRRAAEKHGVRSPLVEAGLRKQDIREISRRLGLQTWDRPSSPCLSSRFPYGLRITGEGLRQVGEAERVLRSFGFRECRVRYHKDIARIELREEDALRLFDPPVRQAVDAQLKALGFAYVVLDLEGFRSGRLNG